MAVRGAEALRQRDGLVDGDPEGDLRLRGELEKADEKHGVLDGVEQLWFAVHPTGELGVQRGAGVPDAFDEFAEVLAVGFGHVFGVAELEDQVAPLVNWITERKNEGVPFIILGDFNRWMDGRDALLADLRKAAPLVRATEGRSSPCWGSENFIDHILAGGEAANWMQPSTLRVLIYRETEPAWRDRLSDPCPVSVRFLVPD